MTDCEFTALPLQSLETALQSKFSTDQPAFFPVLGMYCQGKPSIAVTRRLSELRTMLGERITNARILVLIGLRPTNGDPHLWEPVSKSHASQIGYVGGKDHYEILKSRQGKAIHLAETFEKGFTGVLQMVSN